jgi:hypothetical protein
MYTFLYIYTNPAEVVEFLRTEKFREQVLRVVNLLHVKEPQAPRGPLSKIIGHFSSKYSFQFLQQMGGLGTICLRQKGAS